MKSFVRPYGLMASTGNDSSMGTDWGSPYTVAELLKSRLLHPWRCRHSTSVRVLPMLFL